MPYFPRSLGIPYIFSKSFRLELAKKIAEAYILGKNTEKMPKKIPFLVQELRGDYPEIYKKENVNRVHNVTCMAQ